MDLKSLAVAVEQIAADRGLASERVIEIIESALASAYKREYRKRSEIVRATFDAETGETKFFLVKSVVDSSQVRMEAIDEEEDSSAPAEGELPRFNPDRHILLEEARQTKPGVEVGEDVLFPLEDKQDFGRIAAQTAKQVILQNIRDAERESVRAEFADKEWQIVSGVIQQYERGHVYIDLGRASGVMFQNECIPGERYQPGTRMRFLVIAVQEEEHRRPGIILSRSHPLFVEKLFELEVPEISEKAVEIKKIAREPGSRTKVAVVSHEAGIDAVGAMVGQRGARIMAVINELGNEKIDVIEWSDDIATYIGNSLSPAKVSAVEMWERREALVLVPEDQLSLAIGRGGQNVRLAAKLTGWKIDVRSAARPEELQEGGVAHAPEEEPKKDEVEPTENASIA